MMKRLISKMHWIQSTAFAQLTQFAPMAFGKGFDEGRWVATTRRSHRNAAYSQAAPAARPRSTKAGDVYRARTGNRGATPHMGRLRVKDTV